MRKVVCVGCSPTGQSGELVVRPSVVHLVCQDVQQHSMLGLDTSEKKFKDIKYLQTNFRPEKYNSQNNTLGGLNCRREMTEESLSELGRWVSRN